MPFPQPVTDGTNPVVPGSGPEAVRLDSGQTPSDGSADSSTIGPTQ